MKSMYYCASCEKQLSSEEKPCLNCGNSKRLITAEFHETITPTDNIRIRQGSEGFKKFMLELLQGNFTSINTHLSKGVFKRRLIDKQDNKYEEYVSDNRTGNVLRDVKEKLTEHRHN